MKNGSIRIVASAVMMAMAGTLFAATAEDPRNVQVEHRTVNFADLDLQKPAGIAMLHRRLRTAAAQVCPAYQPDFHQLKKQRDCRQDALDNAIAQLPSPVQGYHARWVAQGSKWHADVREDKAGFVAAQR
jgi:UrcA family protein